MEAPSLGQPESRIDLMVKWAEFGGYSLSLWVVGSKEQMVWVTQVITRKTKFFKALLWSKKVLKSFWKLSLWNLVLESKMFLKSDRCFAAALYMLGVL